MNRKRRRAGLAIAAGLALAASLAVYLWTVQSARGGLHLWGHKQDYYNLLTRGFMRGHLSMDAAPDPALLKLPVKDRPGQAPFLLDASLYRNRYYLYFGVAPVLFLFLPYSLATGQGFPEAGAALLFASIGVVFTLLWWNEARRRFFPGLGSWWAVMSVLALALGSAVLSTLRRPLFYEVAITSGYAFAAMSLWAFLKARYAGERSGCWLIAGGVAGGLAVGSRANLAPACVLLVVFAAMGASRKRPGAFARGLILGGASLAAIFGMLAAYNWARFGNPVEFGHRYQLGVEPARLFHVGNFLHNAWIYYLSPPALNGYFPFVAPASESIKPTDYVGRETAHGEFVWVPLAVIALIGLASSRKCRECRGEWMWGLGCPLIVFAVNFVVTASVGVRANRYMLDFHPALVLLVVSALGIWAARCPKLVSAGLGLGLAAAVVFNVLGSLQAQGLFRATDPGAYSELAEVSDRIVWPFLRAQPRVGDWLINLCWPLQPTAGRSEPLSSSGIGGEDDVVWVDYGRKNEVRLAYQYTDLGRTYGRWFSIVPGGGASIRVSGAQLLPRPGHPWYGQRSRLEQEILKRSLQVTVDGTVRFDRDVPSHDSSPSLERWGTWRRGDGVTYAFDGPALKATSAAVDATRASQAMSESGAIRMRVEFAPESAGRFEPLLQSGTYKRFDTLVLHLTRPGYIQLVHDQLGGGARWSDEFRVDFGRPQVVEVDLPFADDRIDWRGQGPEFRGSATERIRVRWNGRTVFEPEAAVVSGTRAGVVLGANLLRSSVCQAMFDGILERLPNDRKLGGVHSGDLELADEPDRAFESDCGLLARFSRKDGVESGLCWQREGPTGSIRLGWSEGGTTHWSDRSVPVSMLSAIVVGISETSDPVGRVWRGSPDIGLGRVVVDVNRTSLLAVRTAYFSSGPVEAVGWPLGDWSGSALSQSSGGRAEVVSPDLRGLPGRVRLALVLERDRPVSSSPLVEAGSQGAADSLYLRSLGGERYVVGLDHWGVGAIESAPFRIEPARIANITIDLSSLGSPMAGSGGGVRVSIDGQLLLDRPAALYPVKSGQVYVGANPLGMTTSARVFEGDLASVRFENGRRLP